MDEDKESHKDHLKTNDANTVINLRQKAPVSETF